MLLQVNIVNFALIESLTISFNKGLNILTGETGAGKSILIDAINYVLGGKFSKDLIRTGENKTYVEAVFTIENPKTQKRLEKLDIQFDDMVIISRETFQSGKSLVKINGKALILSQVKWISETLIDIHGQHENQALLDSSSHIQYLDYFGEKIYGNDLENYTEKFKKFQDINSKINEITGSEGNREKVIDYLKFQLNEIESAKLKLGEDEELEDKYKLISNSEKINCVMGRSYEILYNGSEESMSVHDSIGFVVKELRTIEKNLQAIRDIADSLEGVYYNIEENIERIRDIKDSIIYDENELQYINERLYQINNFKKKYGKSISEIFVYRDKMSEQLNELTNSEEIIKSLKEEKELIKRELVKISEAIHIRRIEAASELEKRVKSELNYIGLEKSIFKVEVNHLDDLSSKGCDKVQFCISTNPGEPIKPLEKIVSGGELSRIMLALKTVFVDKDQIPSVIFDEIDTGISGKTASSVGEKMFNISCKHQVFCVTHLPQIACMSDVHYLISKTVKENKTFTEVKEMNYKEKEYEIARMIGGAEVTKLTLENSKEIIRLANFKKQEIFNKVG